MAAGDDKEICPECKILVVCDDKGLLCDGFCDKWHHAKCVNINSVNYSKIEKVGSFMKWLCSACVSKIETMRSQVLDAEDFTDLHGMVGSLLKRVRAVVDDNSAINNKLDSICKDHDRLSNDVKTLFQPNSLSSIPTQINESINVSDARPTIDCKEKSNIDRSTTFTELDSKQLEGESDKGRKSGNGSYSKDFPILPAPNPDCNGKWTEVVSKKNKMKVNKPANSMPTLKHDDNIHGRGSAKSAISTSTKLVTNQSLNHQHDPTNAKRPRPRPSTRKVIVGTNEKSDNLSGDKKAWFYLGRIKKNTDVETVESYITDQFPGINVTVEKLDGKGTNDSFKIGVDFYMKDKLMNGSVWPKNVQVKRFLFWRTSPTTAG